MPNWEEITVDDTGKTDVPTASNADLDDCVTYFCS